MSPPPPCPPVSPRSHGTGARRLVLVLGITAVYTVAEVAGGLLSGSLALLADAGHMLADVGALALALLAAWFALRPPDRARTYGYQRAEILGALINGVTLVFICVMIFWEAWERFRNPPAVDYQLMSWIAAGGLLVNVAGAWILHGRGHGFNVRAAYLHVLGDLLGSVGALLAAAAIGLFGWLWADPLASAVIGVIVVVSAVRLVLRSVHVLMEGAPSDLSVEEVGRMLRSVEGVGDIHDLHLWSLAGGAPLLSAHLVLDRSVPAEAVLRAATDTVYRRFGITHSTLQVEPPDFDVFDDLARAAGRTGTTPESAPAAVTDRT